MKKQTKIQNRNRKVEVIGGKRYPYPCRCHNHTFDCVTQKMWDALSAKLYKRGK